VARPATAPGSAPRPAGLKLDFPSPSTRTGPDPPADISERAQSSIAAFAMAYRRPYISAMSETMTTTASEAMAIDEIVDNFSLLEEWDDRYRYLIELGRGLTPLTERDRTEANKVQGCASQVWLATTVRPNGANGPVLTFCGDSDAHIVRGLIAILLATLSDKPAREILSTDAVALFERLGLREHLTPQRSNGFRSMVERIRSDARAALASAA
jgi:cysteine desulfuration protein SufE